MIFLSAPGLELLPSWCWIALNQHHTWPNVPNSAHSLRFGKKRVKIKSYFLQHHRHCGCNYFLSLFHMKICSNATFIVAYRIIFWVCIPIFVCYWNIALFRIIILLFIYLSGSMYKKVVFLPKMPSGVRKKGLSVEYWQFWCIFALDLSFFNPLWNVPIAFENVVYVLEACY